jgi:demethylmenaquinone methyltransferase/2-methoxy-6-polyprenyl-1,4-benzoquinol methylase
MKNMTFHQNYFDQKAVTWSNYSNQHDLERLSDIFKNRLPRLISPVLDVGCGTGILLDQLYAVGQELPTVIEVDLSLQMLIENQNKNRSKYPAFYLQTNVEDIPIKAESINSIICFASFAHFQNKSAVLQNFHKILKSGGYLLILHLMCHRRLNHLHNHAGFPVRNDCLPAVNELSDMTISAGFRIKDREENKDIYLIIAQK